MGEMMWQLRYRSGEVLDEPTGHGSIRNARPGAISLLLTEQHFKDGVELRQAWQRIDLEDVPIIGVSGVLTRVWQPIFYRQRSMELNGRAPRGDGSGHLDAIVFGRGREGSDVHIDTQLWAWVPGMGRTVKDCPPKLIAEKTCELQVLAPTG